LRKEEFKILFDKYFDSVRSYLVYRGAKKEQATDIAQDVFMRVWEKQMNVDEKTGLRLLYKMAGDMFISQFRREKLEINYRLSLTAEEMDISPDEQLRHKELYEGYIKALSELNEKQRIVFMMSRMEGLKNSEIATRLNLSVKAVEKRMSLALAYMRNVLQV
jgi:RNA polymerase sigma factor (sigma-70 family)